MSKTDEEIYAAGERVINRILNKPNEEEERKSWKNENERIEAFKKKYGITHDFYRGFPVNSWSWKYANDVSSYYHETYWTDGKIVERDVQEGNHTSHKFILEGCLWIIVEDRHGISFCTSLEDMQEIEDAVAKSEAVKQYIHHLGTKDWLSAKKLMYFEDGNPIEIIIRDNEYPLDVWDVHDFYSDGEVKVIKTNINDNSTRIICDGGSFLSFYVGKDKIVCSTNRKLFALEEKLLSQKEITPQVFVQNCIVPGKQKEKKTPKKSKKRLSYSRSEIMKIRSLKEKYNISEIHWQEDVNGMTYTVQSELYFFNFWTDGTPMESELSYPHRDYLYLKDAKWVIFEAKDETHLYTTVKDYASLEELLNESDKAKEYLAHLDFKKRLGISRVRYYKEDQLFEMRIGIDEYSNSKLNSLYSDGKVFYRYDSEKASNYCISMIKGTWFMFSVGETKILCTEIRDIRVMEEIIANAKEIEPRYVLS